LFGVLMTPVMLSVVPWLPVIDRNNVFIVLLLMIGVDIGVGTSLELHGDKFCYLGDMLSVDGNADATEVE